MSRSPDERIRHGHVACGTESLDPDAGRRPVQIPRRVRRAEDTGVGSAVAVVVARNRNVSVRPERERVERGVLGPKNEPLAVRRPSPNYPPSKRSPGTRSAGFQKDSAPAGRSLCSNPARRGRRQKPCEIGGLLRHSHEVDVGQFVLQDKDPRGFGKGIPFRSDFKNVCLPDLDTVETVVSE